MLKNTLKIKYIYIETIHFYIDNFNKIFIFINKPYLINIDFIQLKNILKFDKKVIYLFLN